MKPKPMPKTTAYIESLVADMAEQYDVNYAIEHGRSERFAGTHVWFAESDFHLLTFSRVWLWRWQHELSYDAGQLWSQYGTLRGVVATWALVVHEFAHAVQAQREPTGPPVQDHGVLWSECVRELQAKFPPPTFRA